MNYTQKNLNRDNHQGGNRTHIEARAMRRLLGGAFGKANFLDDFTSLDASFLATGTSAQKVSTPKVK